MGEKLTPERAREEIAGILAFTQQYGSVLVVTDEDAHGVAERIAALTLALAALDAVARVRALHREEGQPHWARCAGCGHAYPCPTIRALDGEADHGR